jgi:hypothetical protein
VHFIQKKEAKANLAPRDRDLSVGNQKVDCRPGRATDEPRGHE